MEINRSSLCILCHPVPVVQIVAQTLLTLAVQKARECGVCIDADSQETMYDQVGVSQVVTKTRENGR